MSAPAKRVTPPSAGDPGEQRIAVIDIGSNSIRLVVFDGLKRAFLPVFNEKVICGLGRGMAESGRLSEEGVAQALINLPRFVAMARGMGVTDITLLATAAAREAENGADFIEEVEQRCQEPVQILSGREEARTSGLGVLVGAPDAEGVMGDLGGGSLELAELHDGQMGESATLPLGALRLLDLAKDGERALRQGIDQQLESLDWLARLEGRDFHAVGGSWRNLARLNMNRTGYPLRVIQSYSLKRDEALELARLVGKLGPQDLARLPDLPKRRLDILPFAALLMNHVLRHCRPRRVVFSAYGLRDGLVFERLPAAERAKDPLLAAARDFAQREGRFGDLGDRLAEWVAPLLVRDAAGQRRLIEAACHLSDFAWREHSDYRAGQALFRVLHYPFCGLDHPGRAFLALAVHARYGGNPAAPEADPALTLLGGKAADGARALGLALRLAYTLSAGTEALLQGTRLLRKGKTLRLILPGDGSVPSGEAVVRRFGALCEAAGLTNAGIEA